MSDAVLYRLVEREQPTLLWDEVDGLFGTKARDREDTRKLLNAGFEAGATAWRMGGKDKTTFEEFNIFLSEGVCIDREASRDADGSEHHHPNGS
jgi:hypothetical protein